MGSEARDSMTSLLPGHVLESLHEGCQVIGFDLRYLYANEAAARHGRTTREHLLGRTMEEAYPGIEQTPMFGVLRRCMLERTHQQMENEFTFPDGTRGWFELRFVPVPEGVAILSQDITARKESEARLLHLNAVLRGIRNVNQLITRERDSGLLIQRACDLLVESRGFLVACIALTHGTEIREFAMAGAPEKQATLRRMLARGELPDCMRRAMGGDGCLVLEDPARACPGCPVNQDFPLPRDAITCPLSNEGRRFGALVVSVPPGLGQANEEADLLAEIAGDLAFALRSIELETDRGDMARAALAGEQRYRALFESMTEGVAIQELVRDADNDAVDYRTLEVNPAFERLVGSFAGEITGRLASERYGTSSVPFLAQYRQVADSRRPLSFDGGIPLVNRSFRVSLISLGGDRVATLLEDITTRKENEHERELALSFLRQVNDCTTTRELVERAVRFFQQELGFEAVGIRLQEGEDFPYFGTRGFPEEFVRLESSLCERDTVGGILRDGEGYPLLECMCGNVLRGRVDPRKPFFTAQGSFWTNSTTELLATTTEADRQARTRNRCNGEGYESVAVIPLRSGEGCLGLLQLNDSRKGRFSEGGPVLQERLAAHLAVALAKLRAEEDRQRSDARFRSLFANASFGIATCRMLYEEGRPSDFIYLEVNPAFETLTGLRNVAGRKVSEVIPGIQEEDPFVFELYGRVARGGPAERIEYMVQSLHQWFDVSVYSPQPDHFVAVFDVITKRKQAEEGLTRFSTRLERLAQVVQELSSARSLNAVQAIVRQAARDLAGSDGATFVLRDGDMCHYVDEDAISPLWKGKRFPVQQCISGWVMLHRQAAVIEDIYQDDRIPQEAYRPTFVRSLAMVPIRRADPVGAIGNYWARPYRATEDDVKILQALADATAVALENVRVVAELERSERRYRELVENLDDVVFSLDTEGRFRYVSPAASKFGYSPEEFKNLHFSQFVHPEDLPKAVESFSRTLTGQVAPVELRAYDKAGKVRTIRSSGKVVVEDGRPIGTAGVLVDLTERRETEERLRLAQRLESVGRLAGGVAHDFNNLLSVIISYTEFALDGVRADDPLRRDLEEVLTASRRAAKLTHQLLAFSRKQVLQPEVLDLGQVVGEMQGMLRRLLGEDIMLELVAQPGLGRVRADPGQIEQVVMNLAVNARDAMPKGGRLTFELTDVELDEDYAEQHVAVRPGPYVLLAVSDTGTGMDAATKAQLFQPFFTTKEKGKGTGLGLATVYGIVKQSEGNIWVYSEPGQGTTFKIYLPRVLSAEETASRATRVEERPTGTETILLVEDEEAVRNLARRILGAAGYTVLSAANGGEALLVCEQHPGDIHLLVTDVVMPQMNGRELAERLARTRPGMKVLFMSGYTDNAIVHHGVLDHGVHFLAKPIHAASLRKMVREVLDGA